MRFNEEYGKEDLMEISKKIFSSGYKLLVHIIACIFLVLSILSLISNNGDVYYTIYFVALSIIIELILFFTQRHYININYNRLVEVVNNEGVYKYTYTFSDNGIKVENRSTGANCLIEYSSFTKCKESDHYFILVTKANQFVALSKNNIKIDDIRKFLPNIIKVKSSKRKIILIVVGIFASILLLVGIVVACFMIILKNGLEDRIDNIKYKIEEKKEQKKIREDIYDSIPKELINRNMFPNDLMYVGSAYGWVFLSTNESDKYYFYIDDYNYDVYKHYWLEGIDKEDYTDNYNRDLIDYGSYIFKAINVSDLIYTDDVEYRNVHLTANKKYYLVQIYDEAIYYRWLSKAGEGYIVFSKFNCKNDSLSKEYIFYEENNKWEVEELHR